MTWPIPAPSPDERAEMLERELPGVVALRGTPAWPWRLTADEAARAAEEALDTFRFIAEQERREARQDGDVPRGYRSPHRSTP